jgi:putative ABC transport system permease protein
MFLNYLKTSIRSLMRNKLYTAINILGLSIAAACCLMITFYIVDQWSVNRGYTNSENTYRALIKSTLLDKDKTTYIESTSPKLFDVLEGNTPGILSVARVGAFESVVIHNNEFFKEKILHADPTIFHTLDIEIVNGNRENPLEDKSSTIISQEFVDKYFDGEDPVGKALTIDHSGERFDFTVEGVYKSSSIRSSFDYGFIANFEWLREQTNRSFQENWGLSYSSTLISLEDGVDVTAVEESVNKLLEPTEFNGEHENEMNEIVLQKFSETYISMNNPYGYPTATDSKKSIILASICLTILVIACLNFTSLAIGRSTTRSREIGVRKVMGANRGNITRQFWIETAILTTFSLLLGLLIAYLLLPLFNELAESDLTFNLNSYILGSMIILGSIIVALAGGYPATVMSRFSPVNAFKGEVRVGGKNRLRYGLLFIQFGISITLIAMTLIMSRQMAFISNQDLGYTSDMLIEIPVDCRDDLGLRTVGLMRQELSGNSNVINITGSSNMMGEVWNVSHWVNNNENGEEWNNIHFSAISYNYIETMELELVQGRDFSIDFPADEKKSFIINERFAEYMGWDEPIGKEIPGGGFPENEVIGVVKDFHFESLSSEIEPLMLSINPVMLLQRGIGCSLRNWYTVQHLVIRIAPENVSQTIEEMKTAWQKVRPEKNFEFKFVDEKIQNQYLSEKRWNSIIKYSSLMTILIAALGLFGLSTLEVAHRTKEIGVRKVLGASTKNLVILLSKQITILVLVANLVAWPAAWYLMNRWLDNFAYKTAISPVSMGIAGVSALIVAWLTVGFLSWRAANTNPIKTLRSE